MPNSNKLKQENSPYLLQHASNPVHWQAWNDQALKQALVEDKPIILSIGYAACHWCHVMEHESFEDEGVARIMNENYICIKVDREERPDVDQIYMDAIQTMGLNGGWPLNVFLMPDQKPFYGGTYFPKENWLELLDKVAIAYQTSKDKLAESAHNFSTALNKNASDYLNLNFSSDYTFEPTLLDKAIEKILKSIDWDNGGTLGAPKFPMPVIYEFINSYCSIKKHIKAREALILTLNEMSKGGIYDQIGGGFSRYSVDAEWFAPHFEKMLYDNAQLISLYAKAYRKTGNNAFKDIAAASIAFVNKELKSDSNGYYCALDADSEGVEGKFYTWTAADFDKTLPANFSFMRAYYAVSASGNWEDGRNILYTPIAATDFARQKNLGEEEFDKLLKEGNLALLAERNKRIRPALDDKILCGWNALQLNALCEAYKMDGQKIYLDQATQSYRFIMNAFFINGSLLRNHKNGKSTITAYLEDYALVIQALISYFEISSDDQALKIAEELTEYTFTNFYDKAENLFYYTDVAGETLIARKKEVFDNVIPSSNAVMAHNLHWLALLTNNSDWMQLSDKMVHQLKDMMPGEPQYLSKWLQTYCLKAYQAHEIVICGEDAAQMQLQLWKNDIANAFVLIKNNESEQTIFKGKEAISGKTTIYVCKQQACRQPVFSIKDALKQIEL